MPPLSFAYCETSSWDRDATLIREGVCSAYQLGSMVMYRRFRKTGEIEF